MDTAGMYGAILLHEGAGGYVLVAVAVFTLAVVITVICMRLHERERQKQKRERKDKEDAIEKSYPLLTLACWLGTASAGHRLCGDILPSTGFDSDDGNTGRWNTRPAK